MSLFRFACRKILIVVLALTAFLKSAPAQLPAGGRTATISVSVTTPNRSQPIAGLEKAQFTLFQEKEQREITSVSTEDQPASVVILVDTSGSMSKSSMAFSANFVMNFIATSTPGSEFLLIDFSKESRTLCDWNCTSQQMVGAIDIVSATSPKQRTALFDACQKALLELGKRRNAKQAIVVVTDGADNFSKVPFSELRDSLKRSNVVFYGVSPNYVAADDIDGEKYFLDKLAEVSGGTAFLFQNYPLARDIARKVSANLRFRFLITFKPAGQPDQKFHSIKVKVLPLQMERGARPAQPVLYYRSEFFDK